MHDAVARVERHVGLQHILAIGNVTVETGDKDIGVDGVGGLEQGVADKYDRGSAALTEVVGLEHVSCVVGNIDGILREQLELLIHPEL